MRQMMSLWRLHFLNFVVITYFFKFILMTQTLIIYKSKSTSNTLPMLKSFQLDSHHLAIFIAKFARSLRGGPRLSCSEQRKNIQ